MIGSTVALEYRGDAEGYGTIVHKPEAELFDDGPAKPVRSGAGRPPPGPGGRQRERRHRDARVCRPCVRPSLRLLVLHDDAEREFDYVAGAEKALSQAARDGWTVVSIKDDWAQVFAAEHGS